MTHASRRSSALLLAPSFALLFACAPTDGSDASSSAIASAGRAPTAPADRTPPPAPRDDGAAPARPGPDRNPPGTPPPPADQPPTDPPPADPPPTDPPADQPPTDPPVGTSAWAHPSVTAVLDLPATPLDYRRLPPALTTAGVSALDNTPAGNAIRDEIATLGRVLFYDESLSLNGTIACASCHDAAHGFADPRRLSLGFEGGETGRNSMSLINLRFYGPGRMFWDERAEDLEHQVLMPIQDSVEMGMNLATLTTRLAGTAHYPILFEAAFGDAAVTSDRISRALAQFVRSIVSAGSRYDRGLAATGDPRQPFAGFSAAENRGKQLFFTPPNAGGAGCAGCHLPPTPNAGPGAPPPPPGAGNASIFFMDRPRNNGLTDGREPDPDLGVGGVTGRPQDIGRFKSPSLRNVARTAPYMHDGSIATLRDVVVHYAQRVQPHPNLDPRLRRGPNGPPQRLPLSAADIDALVAFMETLSDDGLAGDPRWSDPWR